MSLSERDFQPSVTLPKGYTFKDSGLFWQSPKPPEKEGEEQPFIHIAGSFDVAVKVRDGLGGGWGLLLRWQDSDGRDHQAIVQNTMLAGDGMVARSALMEQGLYISNDKFARAKFNEFLLKVDSPNRAISCDTVGWNGAAFVLPDESIGGESGELLVLQNPPQDHPFKQAGTLQEWQAVAKLAVGNSRLALAVSMAFVGPLLLPCSEEGGGVHLKGSSSIGKTTALRLAASVWGGGTTDPVRSWRATANGLEGTCRDHSDTFLALDEMAQIEAVAAGEAAYMLANGSGKSRSKTDGSARKIARFRIMFLSSGEIGLAEKVSEGGGRRKTTAGQQIRVVDLVADPGAGRGLFEELHGFESGKDLSRHIVSASRKTYGTAGRAFLTAILPEVDTLKDRSSEFTADFCTRNVPAGADGQVGRVAQRFALIAFAGEVAVDKGILPWPKGEAVKAAEACLKSWIAERGHLGSAETHDAVESIRQFLQAKGLSHFIPAWDEDLARLEHERLVQIAHEAGEGARPPLPMRPPVAPREVMGFRRRVVDLVEVRDSKGNFTGRYKENPDPANSEWEYFVNSAGWAEMCAGRNPKTVQTAMLKAGGLDGVVDGRFQVLQRVPGYTRGRYYHIPSSFMRGR